MQKSLQYLIYRNVNIAAAAAAASRFVHGENLFLSPIT